MESRRYRALILAGIVLLAFYAAYSYFSGPDSRQSTPEQSESTPKQQLTDFTLDESISDTEVWSLRAPRADQSGDTVQLESPRVVYRVAGDTRLVITSEKGYYAIDRQVLRVWGSVRLNRIRENQILETNTLQWNRNEEVIRTDAEITMRMPRGVLRARGMRTHLREETIQFLSDVQFSSKPADSSSSSSS